MINSKTISFSDYKLVFLSYPWGESCPAYGNGARINLTPLKSICCGDSCNTLQFTSNNHIGTHYDFPLHFDKSGKDVHSYNPLTFLHNNISYIHLNLNENELVSVEHLQKKLDFKDSESTILLIRTGNSLFRNEDSYWKNGSGIDKGVATFLRANFPKIHTVGIDTLSITSYTNRELGREVHKEFLSEKKPIIIIEDLNLEPLENTKPEFIISLPLRIENGDGAPATVIAGIDKNEMSEL